MEYKDTSIVNSNVLIISGHSETVETLTEYFNTAGYPVRTSTTGEDGLASARVREFKVVLVDMELAGITGENVLCKLKALFPDISVIMIARSENQKAIQRCLEGGAYDYITAPIDMDLDYLETSVLSTVYTC